jgi:hypothetical protein
MKPRVEQLSLPPEYGKPAELLDWADVDRQLREATAYWVASVRPDGRPHTVPRDGLLIDDTWYYGGSDATVHNRNLVTNPALSMHIGDGITAIIVEGVAKRETPGEDVAEKMAGEHNRKYSHYGKATAQQYASTASWALKAQRVIAWTNLPVNATRFIFADEGSSEVRT